MKEKTMAFFSSQAEEKKRKTQRKKKTIEKEKNAEKGGSLPFFSRFCIWDEAPLAFSSPPSFNIELSTFLKPCVSRLLEALCYSSSGTLLSFGDGVSKK
jgi:hypothetical protein